VSLRSRSRGAPLPLVAGALVLLTPIWSVSAVALSASVPAGAATTATQNQSGAPALTLLGQSPFVTPGQPLRLQLAPARGTPRGDRLQVTLYDKLTSRSAFEQTLSSPPNGAVLDRTDPVALSDLAPGAAPPPASGVGLSIAIDSTGSASGTNGQSLTLSCTPGIGECEGVYPLEVALLRPSGATAGRLTTYLTYDEGLSPNRLRFSWVVPVAAPVTIRDTGAPADVFPPPATHIVAALGTLAGTLEHAGGAPVTVTAQPQTLQALQNATGGKAPAARQAVATLGALSAAGADEFLSQPYVSLDAGALSGEPTELRAQMDEGASTARTAGVVTSPGPLTWVTDGPVGSRLGASLAFLGATHLVLPESDLAPPTGTSSSRLTWSAPFALALGRGVPVQAAASDSEISAQFEDDPSQPALEANQILAGLALIHFEAPNLDAPRGIVAVPPQGWLPSAAFDDQLLAGLQGNPDVEPVTLNQFFAQVPQAGAPNSAEATGRRLQNGGPGAALPAALARQISGARLRLSAFDSAVPTGTAVLSQLDNVLLAAESESLTTAGQSAGVDTFERGLGAQLSLVQLAADRTITLTARTGAIPITLLSGAPYAVTGNLVLKSDKFVFLPPGATRAGIVLNHPTTPVRVDATARTSGDLPVTATFDSPRGGLVIAQAELTVRSTATSLVGVLLTALALAVLLGWWARTWWSGRRRRAAHDGRR